MKVMIALAVAGLGTCAGQAHADVSTKRPSAAGGEPCSAWCGRVKAWETVESGAGPETGPTTILGLGVASETVRLADRGSRAETAAVFGFEFRFPLTLRDTEDAADRALRLRENGQQLGWRVGDRMSASGARVAGDLPGTADSGGSIALGYTETLLWFSHWSRLAATLDAEGATGLGVRGGLGLRTLAVSSRAVGAAGAALGIHTRVVGLRGHARVLQALTSGLGWSRAVEVGAGAATRFDWPRFHGPWPIELWVDVRDRRGTGADAHAREREVTTGINYVRADGFSRIGIVAIASDERLTDGSRGAGRALMVRLDRPFGSQ